MCDALPSLSSRQKQLLRKYFEFYRELSSGRRVPTTEAQRHFCEVCLGAAIPASEHEKAYLAFRATLAAEGLSEIQGIDHLELLTKPTENQGISARSDEASGPLLQPIEVKRVLESQAPGKGPPRCWACNGGGYISPLGRSGQQRCSACKGTGRSDSHFNDGYERYGREISATSPGFIYRDDRFGNRR
jgi:hypothetical protein